MINSSQKHIIQRLVLEVEVNTDPTDPHREEVWLHIVREWIYHTLLPMLEEILDKLSMSNELLRVDQLTLDLGEMSEVDLNELMSASRDRLRTTIEEKVNVIREEQTHKRLSESQNTTEAFFFFLKTGRLPWWYTPRSWPEWEAQILAGLPEYSPNVKHLFKDHAVGQRLVGHFSAVFFEALVRKLFARYNERSVEFQKVVKAFTAAANFPPSMRMETENAVRIILLHFLIREVPIEQLPMYVISHLPEKVLKLWRKAAQGGRLADGKSELKEQLIALLVIEERQKQIPPLTDNQGKTVPEDSLNEASITDDIYIANAGLVLLHPFLNYFFEELKISKNGKMLKPQRAVHLLQWLANGQSDPPEYELPLNKLLCGIPQKTPLIGRWKLTNREKSEAQKLLEAVVRHWDVLKNTSPAGLQGNFLCREGKLTQKSDGDWLLQIERKSIDILLADLPWSISMIQLPWMSHWLWVEWA